MHSRRRRRLRHGAKNVWTLLIVFGKTIFWIYILFKFITHANNSFKPSLVVKGGDSLSRGRVFVSGFCVQVRYFSHLFAVKMYCFFGTTKKIKKAGDGLYWNLSTLGSNIFLFIKHTILASSCQCFFYIDHFYNK